MDSQLIDVEALAAMSNWSPKGFRNALDRGQSGTGIVPRTEKIGGRYAFSIADVLDATFARPLIARRKVTIAEAYQHLRPLIDSHFVRKKGQDADPKLLQRQSEGRYLEAIFGDDETLRDLMVRDRPELTFNLPPDSSLAVQFSSSSILLIPLSDRVGAILHRAEEYGIDLTNIQHGAFR